MDQSTPNDLWEKMWISCKPEIPFSADVWTDAEVYVEASILDSLDEPNQVVSPFEVILLTRHVILINCLMWLWYVSSLLTVKTEDKRGRRRGREVSVTFPGDGSWTFQKTYVSITSSPPSFAFWTRPSHICIFDIRIEGSMSAREQPLENQAFPFHVHRRNGVCLTEERENQKTESGYGVLEECFSGSEWSQRRGFSGGHRQWATSGHTWRCNVRGWGRSRGVRRAKPTWGKQSSALPWRWGGVGGRLQRVVSCGQCSSQKEQSLLFVYNHVSCPLYVHRGKRVWKGNEGKKEKGDNRLDLHYTHRAEWERDGKAWWPPECLLAEAIEKKGWEQVPCPLRNLRVGSVVIGLDGWKCPESIDSQYIVRSPCCTAGSRTREEAKSRDDGVWFSLQCSG